MSLLFTRVLAEKVAAGEKTVTRRAVSDNPRSPWWRERCRWQPGMSVAVLGGFNAPALCRVQIITADLGPLGHLTNREARREGCTGAAAFEALFADLNGGVYDPDLEVWRVAFRREGVRHDG